MNETLISFVSSPHEFEIDFTKYTLEELKTYVRSSSYYVSDNLDKLYVNKEINGNKLYKYGYSSSSANDNFIFEFSAEKLKKVTITVYFNNSGSSYSVTTLLNRNGSYRLNYYSHDPTYARSYLQAPNTINTYIDNNISLSGRQGKYYTTVCDLTKPGWIGKVTGNVCFYNFYGWRSSEYSADAYFNYLKLEYD